MKKLFELLWEGCWHKWHYEGKGYISDGEASVGQYFLYSCTKCQKRKIQEQQI